MHCTSCDARFIAGVNLSVPLTCCVVVRRVALTHSVLEVVNLFSIILDHLDLHVHARLGFAEFLQ